MSDIKQIIRENVVNGVSSYDLQYGVNHNLSKYSKPKRQRLRLAKNKLLSVRDTISQFVLNNLDKVNWNDIREVNDFCLRLDKKIEECQSNFLEGCDKMEKVDANLRWESFRVWINDIRLFVRNRIENILREQKETAGPKGDEIEVTLEIDAADDQVTAPAETPAPPAETPAPPVVTPASPAETPAKTEEEASAVDPKTAPAEAPPVKTTNEEKIKAVIEKSSLDQPMKTALGDLLAAIYLDDAELVEEMGKTLLAAIKEKIKTLLDQNNEKSRQALNEAVKRIRDLNDQLEKERLEREEEKRELEDKMLEEKKTMDEDNHILRAAVSGLTAQLEEIREELSAANDERILLSRENKSLQIEFEDSQKEIPQQDAPFDAEAIQSQLKEMMGKIEQFSAAIESVRPSAVPKAPESVKPPQEVPAQTPADCGIDLEALDGQVEFLESQIADLHEISASQAEWVGETRQKTEEEIRKMKVFAESDDDYTRIKQIEAAIEEKILAVLDAQKRIETKIGELEEERTELIRFKDAILTVKAGPPAPKNNMADEGVSVADFAVDLPDATQLVRTGGTTVPPVTLRSTAEEAEKEEKSEDATVFKLPYDIDVTDMQEKVIRQFEQLIESLKDMPEKEIRRIIPFDTAEPRYEDYYNEMIEELQKGTFLPVLKMAFTILGALRKNGDFSPRLSKTVGLAMKIKGVALVKMLGQETSAVSRSFMKVCLLGKVVPDFETVLRVSVGSKWGKGNCLTPLGKVASKVWTKDLLKAGKITPAQIETMYAWSQPKSDAGKVME